MLTLDKVYQAAHCLKAVARKTDMIAAPGLTGCAVDLQLKAENLQTTGSFKLRGAFAKIAALPESATGPIVACSAGNHAQGVALAARRLQRKSIIFIPSIAPIAKIEATRALGAEVRIIDGVYDDAYNAAAEYCRNNEHVFVHPFEDEDVIAGQGTIALEILEQYENVDTVLVPVGGGGLLAGIAFTIKKLRPECKVYGVQAAGADGMVQAFERDEDVTLNKVSTFADGIAVKTPGRLTRSICRQYADGILTVNDDQIATAILMLMEKQKLVAEGAGATAVAAVMSGRIPGDPKHVCAVVSGGNIDVNILSRVINRGLVATGRLSELRIEMLDRPGQLKEVSSIIADYGANVTQVRHNLGGEHTDIIGCYLHIRMETRNREQFLQIKEAITSAGYRLLD